MIDLKSISRIALVMMVAALLATSCSTKKNTWTRRSYHNLTAHYNVWWNGNQSIKDAKANLSTKVIDNYTQILPLFQDGTEQEAAGIKSQADRAIEKASIAIQEHSMIFRNEEHCNWIDDSYLMIGKAYYMKQEYRSAIRTFQYIISHYSDWKMLYESRLWLARTYDKRKEFGKAAAELEAVRDEYDFEKLTRKQYELFRQTYANHFILRGEPDLAIPFLKESVIFAQRKMRKRCEFILGQIYLAEGDKTNASIWFEKAAKGAPTYELEFNSRINQAMCYQGGGGSNEIVKKLETMLKDAKNKDFQDQIYYALSRLVAAEDKVPEQVAYLRLSVAKSINNNYQKAKSSLELGEIYFDKTEYMLSQAYYDTCMQVLPSDYPGYKELEKKTAELSDLVVNLMLIKNQDSILNFISLSEEEQNAIIDKIIEEVIKEEERQKEIEFRRMAEAQRGGTTGIPGQTSAKWYFENPQALSQGRKEFLAKWGSRKLEDLWFLSNKQVTSFGEDEDGEFADGEEGAPVDSLTQKMTDTKQRDYYLQSLPTTPEDIAAINVEIAQAFYNAGEIYFIGLKDTTVAISTLDTLLQRYPDTISNKNLLMTYYIMYNMYNALGQMDKKQEIEQLVMLHFPTSDFAKVIKNPNYFKTLEEQANAASQLYAETYTSFKNEELYVVLLNNETAHQEYPADTLLPYFELLNAIATGRLEGEEQMNTLLDTLIHRYDENNATMIAAEILGVDRREDEENIAGQSVDGEETTAGLSAEEIEAAALAKWEYKPNEKQMFILLLKSNSRDMKAVQIRILDFNKKNNRFDKLKINALMVDKESQAVTVSGFPDAEKAVKYYHEMTADEYVMGMIKKMHYRILIIPESDYRQLYKEKNFNEYLIFFQKKYLGEE